MTVRKILIADNDPYFLKTCAQYLEMFGFRVVLAHNPDDARQLLERGAVHVAILDLRMRNDADKMDRSGLLLAKTSNPAIPKIILTSFHEWEDVREALGPGGSNGLTPAVSFVAKHEGLEVLLQHTNRAFEIHVPLNLELEIDWGECERISLAKHVEPLLEFEELAARTEELEDLFRLIFRGKERLRTERLLWRDGERAALTCFAFEKGKKPETLLVVYGRKARIAEEARRFREYEPASCSTRLHDTKAATNLAANIYTLSGAQLEEVRPIEELYLMGADKAFKDALKNLFDGTLAEWSGRRAVPVEPATLGWFYRNRLNLPPGASLAELLADHARALAPSLLLAGIEVTETDGSLRLDVNGGEHSYLLPADLFEHLAPPVTPAEMQHAPGRISGQNVLVDAQLRTWVTDFMAVGLAPPSWAYAEVEALIRFDHSGGARLLWIHEMERQLVFGDPVKLLTSDVEPPLRKALRSIQTVRQMAQQAAGKDLENYQFSILLQTLGRLVGLRPSRNQLGPELVRAAHLLLASIMIYDQLQHDPQPRRKGIRIEKDRREVRVNGYKVSVRGQSYDLLCYFHDRPRRLCTRRELAENVFNERYDETDSSQVNRMNAAISRLREKIEAVPGRPQYLITEPRGGYILDLPPDDRSNQD